MLDPILDALERDLLLTAAELDTDDPPAASDLADLTKLVLQHVGRLIHIDALDGAFRVQFDRDWDTLRWAIEVLTSPPYDHLTLTLPNGAASVAEERSKLLEMVR